MINLLIIFLFVLLVFVTLLLVLVNEKMSVIVERLEGEKVEKEKKWEGT